MIRPMQPKDASVVWEIFQTALKYDCTLDMVCQRIQSLAHDPEHVVWVLTDDADSPHAFIHAQRYRTLHDEGGYNVIALAVMPDDQGKGLGRELLTAFERFAKEQGAAYLRLNSRVERKNAHAFYEHLGYTCDKVQKYFKKVL